MSSQHNSADDVDIDFGRLFQSLIRKWPRILLGALVFAGLALAFVMLSTPKYKASSKILIGENESVFSKPTNSNERSDRNSPVLDEEGVTSQVQIIQSGTILSKVAEDLKLGEDHEYTDEANSSAVSRVLALAGMGKPDDNKLYSERVVDRLRDNLSVQRVEKSRVIVVEVRSESPTLAAEIANSVAETYEAWNRDQKLQNNASATAWLLPEIEKLTQRVKDAEAKVAEYRAQSDLLLGQNNSVLATQQLSELSQELTRVRANRAAAESDAEGVRNALRNGASLDALPDVMSSPLIQRLRERQVQLRADIADLSTTLLDNHPRIKSMRSQLADLDKQLRGEAQKVLDALNTKANTAKVRENQLTSDLNRLKVESARAGEDEVTLRALERDANTQKDLLNSFKLRYSEADARKTGGYQPADAQIFAKATAPAEAYFPKLGPIVGAAFAGGLLIMVLVTMLGELFSGRAMRIAPAPALEPASTYEWPSSVQVAPDVVENRPVSETSRAAHPAAATAHEDQAPFSAFSPQERPSSGMPKPLTVKANHAGIDIAGAADLLVDRGAQRALFISPEGDTGAASSVLVARKLADSGLRILLLDLTAGGAAALPMVEDASAPGITNLLAAQAQFTDIIHPDHYSDVQVIPAGNADPRLAMRAIDRLPMIMDALVTAYDVVIVECGPTDAASLKRLVGDGAEIIVSAINPQEQVVADSTAELERAGYHNFNLVTPQLVATPPTNPGRSAA